ncbi:short-chain dehydrogenase [Candidatus Jettenia caeni]|uniref:Short-chain dehydrogenase n=1 Tax=Candidatus Jettenia caeni TaxID=247490 RepID=I3IHK8_9BACT|nr:glucose 1-dehydrogenase [Candidatus Jettenia sp. AMX1]MCQ3925925.1 SDR family NAD(P)-dependent oxidoreductase [Candidatus Jettenia sp.]WKZ16531.1 MAG: glucose 1-dehydrogenase [Candidatus Jettenia caeni]MDL1937665.1 glucose 1-dehydrogenase [Candidatus Jettenia sp. AMX1]GAB61203.1 short-chain dehydrogenase [Candidatus Jettenia caeni]GIL20744.1 MAG: oxidoreductase [Candidatus Jettenia caeni]
MRLKNKVALITGGGTGIGKATALLFAREGASLVITGRRETPLEETVSHIRNLHKNAIYVIGDVSKADDAQNMVQKTGETFGRLDILVNNAGVNYKPDTTSATEEEGWDITINTNLKGIYLVSKYAIPELSKNGGSIINISSVVGLKGFRKAIAYATSKGGILNMTKSMAIELAPDKIRVNCICPGMIDTDMYWNFIKSSENPDTLHEYVVHSHPLGRIGKPEDIAYGALFLASDEANWITGVILPIDGGFTAR